MSTSQDGRAIDAIDFYWRPGCGFCSALDRKLARLEIPMNKHNIWEDEDHAAFVRSVADGSETVPTVTVGSISMVNPSAGQVLAALADEAPHLVPEDADQRVKNPVGRLVHRIRGGRPEGTDISR